MQPQQEDQSKDFRSELVMISHSLTSPFLLCSSSISVCLYINLHNFPFFFRSCFISIFPYFLSSSLSLPLFHIVCFRLSGLLSVRLPGVCYLQPAVSRPLTRHSLPLITLSFVFPECCVSERERHWDGIGNDLTAYQGWFNLDSMHNAELFGCRREAQDVWLPITDPVQEYSKYSDSRSSCCCGRATTICRSRTLQHVCITEHIERIAL